MEWQLALLFIFGSLIVLMFTGMPVAIAFLAVNAIFIFLLWGAEAGFGVYILSIRESVTSFTLVAVPLFILMGELMFCSGIATRMIDTLDMWLGRIPGRLSLLAVGAGVILGALSGSSMASTAVLGSTLLPDMEKRGYKAPMSVGPILGCGALDTMIPPTALGVILGAIAEISIGKLLVAIIIPGLIMAAFYAAYIILRCRLQPDIAPVYEVPPTPILDKSLAVVRYVLPLGLIIFLVIGSIFLGVATPSEAAAAGSLGTIILALFYRKMNWEIMKKALIPTVEFSVMVLMIIAGSSAFSQILAFTGASRGLAEFVAMAPLPPIVIIILMQVVLLILGCFMPLIPIMMITAPVFMPVVGILGFDPVWFGTMFLLNMEIGTLTPPFGMNLFVMKGVASHIPMGEIWRAALPFIYMNVAVMALILAFPAIALWLPNVMRSAG